MSDERIKKLKERYRKERDYHPDFPHPWEPFFERDPEWFETYQDLHAAATQTGKALSVKDRELIITAGNAIRGMVEGTKNHMQRAFYHGATVEEMFDTAMSVWFVCGSPSFMAMMRALHSTQEEAKKLGEKIAAGKEWLLQDA
jgi:alkylhydroperoxidase/carboxymuconolactone decarboxylase family protein YurZ